MLTKNPSGRSAVSRNARTGALEVVAKRAGEAVAARTVNRALLDRDDQGEHVPEVLRVWLTVEGEEQRLARVRQEGTEEASQRRLLFREQV